MPAFGKKLVFVGGGHAHLHALARIDEFALHGVEVTVIAPGPFWYSGMGPGMLSGIYEKEDDIVDLRALVERQGGRYLEDCVTRIRPKENELLTAGGETLSYDLLSLNVGSAVPAESLIKEEAQKDPADPDARVIRVKPVQNFLALRQRLQLGKLGATPGNPARILVIGGGAAGCETAANARALFHRQEREAAIFLVSSADRLLPELPVRAGRIMEKFCARNGIDVTLGVRVANLHDGEALFEGGGVSMPFDLALLATGVRPARLIAESSLETDDTGAMQVDPHLRSVSHPNVFGGGDGIQLKDRPLARVGVYAVRQGPILFHNLLATLEKESLQVFEPQKKYLLILNLGDGTGLLSWRGLVFRSGLAFQLKDHIDRKFMRTYQLAV